jgi:hypothetical protein
VAGQEKCSTGENFYRGIRGRKGRKREKKRKDNAAFFPEEKLLLFGKLLCVWGWEGGGKWVLMRLPTKEAIAFS